ncbi:Uncharacterized protein BM_BM1004 [Brugia malayi]|uniref:Bm1004 n=1 Tax=Brugia malayi TaxID=6279 RepID=A0A0K0ILV5_BRUMA|nr:Uncharacterized protein BM_BM1004 [Brugia malayi]CDQ01835.1 Bm1004 [Brugia malayi]VIO95954.1 Uncharacterized protein BM_BM1004 [Brugia malayi]
MVFSAWLGFVPTKEKCSAYIYVNYHIFLFVKRYVRSAEKCVVLAHRFSGRKIFEKV